ncbi:hypothetical protein WCN91_15070 [Pseudoalteromonas sp. YIC-827]|uniref:Uncharacterized protein n=1 Tax=Pseudoalteromonas qingdaonensis TaxID=3131913 RepID=A0ABU9MZR0_9GAMM
MYSKRHVERYKGFHIIAAFFRNEFQAKAKHKFLKELRVNKCQSLDNSVVEIKGKIDKYLIENHEQIKDQVIATHKSWMLKNDFEYKGISHNSRYRRASHCYSCKSLVDNSQDIECKACDWIVCSHCGVCGCGYIGPKYA